MSYPSARGACFDNFVADTLDMAPPRFVSVNLEADGRVHMRLTGDRGSTSAVDRASILTNWVFFTNVVQTNTTVEFSDTTNSAVSILSRPAPAVKWSGSAGFRDCCVAGF